MNQRIIYSTPEGGVAVIIPTESVELALKDVPEGAPYEIWVMGDCCIDHDIDRCKTIGHEMRRAARAVEFAPHDEVIAKQIPGVDAAEAEAQRQRIRDKYAVIQEQIDAAETTNDIKTALGIS